MKHLQENKNSNNNIYIGAFIGVLVLLGLCWFLIDYLIDSNEVRGQFGDKFGSINALFSGLAFAGLIVTLIQQKQELSLQREELQETRKELSCQSKEFEEQNKIIRYQRFESSFFSLIEAFNQLRNNLSYRTSDGAERYVKESNGIKLFRDFYESKTMFLQGLNHEVVYGVKSMMEINPNNIHKANDIGVFDHYFRCLYRIIKYVDRSKLIENSDRYEYIALVRSLLSDYELVMLFYNCLGEEGGKSKILVEKYSILKNLNIKLLADQKHRNLFAKSAFERDVQ